jgi:hypothetical protein
MENTAYLDWLGVFNPEKRALALEAMARYADQHCWEHPAALTRIRHQLQESAWLLEAIEVEVREAARLPLGVEEAAKLALMRAYLHRHGGSRQRIRHSLRQQP